MSKLSKWASAKSFAYYKTQTDTNGKPGSYKDLPRYLEIIQSFYHSYYGGHSLHKSIKSAFTHRWVIRSKA